jgi:anti-sigma B factor antagonist
MASNDHRVRWIGGYTVVAVPAEVDVTNADAIRKEMLSAVSLGAPVVIIDMSGTTFCDSAGVEAVIVTYRQAAANGAELRLAATTAGRVFTLVGADQLIPIYPTLEAALAGTPSARTGTHDSAGIDSG